MNRASVKIVISCGVDARLTQDDHRHKIRSEETSSSFPPSPCVLPVISISATQTADFKGRRWGTKIWHKTSVKKTVHCPTYPSDWRQQYQNPHLTTSLIPPGNLLWHPRPTPKLCFGITTSLIRGFNTLALPYFPYMGEYSHNMEYRVDILSQIKQHDGRSNFGG